MHCNRLMGPSDDEQRAVAIAAQLHRWRTGMVRRATGEARPVAT
jgi:hypothetical protein